MFFNNLLWYQCAMLLVFRQFLVVILIPVYLIVGGFVGDFLATVFGVWNYYFYSFLFPIIGIAFTWVIAPWMKIFNMMFIFALGITLAYFFTFPAYYPEPHPLAYLPTYRPFGATAIVGLATLAIFISYELINHNKNRQQDDAKDAQPPP